MEEREWLLERNSGLVAEALGRGAVKYTWGAVRSWRTWHLAVMNLVANIPKCEARLTWLVFLVGFQGLHRPPETLCLLRLLCAVGIIFWCPLIIDALLGKNRMPHYMAIGGFNQSRYAACLCGR